MKLKALGLLGSALTAAVLIVAFSDPSNAGLRFLSKLMILAIVLAVPLSMLIRRFFGRDANRKFWGMLILLGISFSIALLAAEFVIRIAFRDVTTTHDNSSYFANRWYSLHPPALNEWGFRERDVSRIKSPDTYRIATIGDSLTYGQGVPCLPGLSRSLEHELNRSAGRYEVLNFGRPGAETDDHLRIFDEVVLDLSPDFILLQWFINDVEISHSDRAAAIRLVPSNFVDSWLHSHSALYYLIDSQWRSLQGALGLTESYLDNMTRRFMDPDGEESLAASAALERLIWQIKEQNISVGIVLFPVIVDVYGDPDGYPLGFLMDRALVSCDKHGVPCLDLRPIFAGALSTPKLWANSLDHHPSAIANKMASEAILTRFAHVWGVQ